MTETELPQKQQPIGRTRRALRALHDLFDRALTGRAVVAATVLLLVASWIYPPWFERGGTVYVFGGGSYHEASHAWHSIFNTHTGAMRIDFGRLVLIDLVIAVVGGLFAWAISHDSTARRVTVGVALCSTVALPLIAIASAIIYFGVILVGNIQQAASKKYVSRFDPSTATLVPEEREGAQNVKLEPLNQEWQNWLAANGYYFVTQRVDVPTASGVQSLPPGTVVRFLSVFGNSFDVTADGLVTFTVTREKLTIDPSELPPSARKDAASVQAAVKRIESKMGPFGAQ